MTQPTQITNRPATPEPSRDYQVRSKYCGVYLGPDRGFPKLMLAWSGDDDGANNGRGFARFFSLTDAYRFVDGIVGDGSVVGQEDFSVESFDEEASARHRLGVVRPNKKEAQS